MHGQAQRINWHQQRHKSSLSSWLLSGINAAGGYYLTAMAIYTWLYCWINYLRVADLAQVQTKKKQATPAGNPVKFDAGENDKLYVAYAWPAL